jgi:sarcosine oxidase subunit delta
MWVHAVGCRKFFNVTRHTVSYEILETYNMGEQPSITADSQSPPREAAAVSQQQGVRA